MERTVRRFETVTVVQRVRVKVPRSFSEAHFIKSGKIELDGNLVQDRAHFFHAAVVAGQNVNRHYYFHTPLINPGVKVVVAEVRIVTEMLSDGRRFTRLNIYPYAGNELAEYDVRFPNNGDAGIPIEGGKGSVVFRAIRRPVARILEARAAEPESAPVTAEAEPELLSLDETAAAVDKFIDVLAKQKVVIPRDRDKTQYGRACWALYQLNLKKGKGFSRDRALARFQESLESHLGEFQKSA